ncbi:MAG: response regulator transcription factor [Thermoanaerobacteraceae bacterium]|nr:response regulator transcription factor [Thermoanaerobacteraceae bacterium]
MLAEKERVMIVDDDEHIRELLRLYLEKEGYETSLAVDGNQALSTFQDKGADLIILDVMMPGLDGWEVCREIRKNSGVPIVMLTAKGESFDKLTGFELGADDYVVKPFEPKEIVARVKAVLRRAQPQVAPKRQIAISNLVIDMEEYVVKVGDETLELAPKEIELLYFLASNANQVFSREQLIEQVWGYDYLGDTRTIDVHVKRLRSKLRHAEQDWHIKTVWGVGYKFEVK